MKTNVILIVAVLLCGCGHTISHKENKSRNPTVDTVSIDAGTKTIFLRDNLIQADVSSDGRLLYNFNSQGSSIEQINLEDEVLERTIEIEREGPNGIGGFVLGLNVLNDSLIVVSGTNSYSVVDNQGILVKRVSLDHHFFFDERLKDASMANGFLYRDQKAFAILAKHQSFDNQLMVYFEDTDSLRVLDIAASELIKNASVVSVLENSSITHSPQLKLSWADEKILITHRTYPDIVVLDVESLAMVHYYPDSRLYNKIEPVAEVPEIENEEKLNEIFLDLEKRMNFLPPVWDIETKKYYRWGFKLKTGETGFENASFDNFLFEMDSMFSVVNETKLPEITFRPSRIFLRGNKLYLYQNVNDELLFIRVSIDGDSK